MNLQRKCRSILRINHWQECSLAIQLFQHIFTWALKTTWPIDIDFVLFLFPPPVASSVGFQPNRESKSSLLIYCRFRVYGITVWSCLLLFLSWFVLVHPRKTVFCLHPLSLLPRIDLLLPFLEERSSPSSFFLLFLHQKSSRTAVTFLNPIFLLERIGWNPRHAMCQQQKAQLS